MTPKSGSINLTENRNIDNEDQDIKVAKMSCCEEKKLRCARVLAHYIINPTNRYKMMWEILIAMCYVVSFIVDPYIFGFWFEPLVDETA